MMGRGTVRNMQRFIVLAKINLENSASVGFIIKKGASVVYCLHGHEMFLFSKTSGPAFGAHSASYSIGTGRSFPVV